MKHLKIIKGDATPEEVAAVVIALSSQAGPSIPASESAQTPKSWSNHAHGMRKQLPNGQGAWRSSALPR
ncbi:acyl-CoA carboxylase subunit epsilon [Streptosporangium sp. NPDC023615]|uniref:acyl-CoA carboxylase subunit epsilon n=1 Tax=Streptosporangium sp. NPDC023615 TaxID=3154794 RepID=UPI0034222A25